MELFPEVIISEEPAICFEMRLNATKLKKKLIKIKMEKWEIEEPELIKLKLENLSKEFKKEAALKDDKIKKLMRSNEEHEETITILKEEIAEIKRDQENLFL